MKTPIMEFIDFSAGYGKMEIVHGVSFEVMPSEVVAIVGPNGAGKSTIFKCLFGLADLLGGRVRYKNKDITKSVPPFLLLNGLVYLPQGHSNFPAMSVLENLEMGAYVRKEGVAEDIDRLLREYPLLGEKQRQRAGELSGGEQKIMEVARSMLYSPDVLLIDEPSAGLDPTAVSDVYQRILEVNQEGAAIVLIEQAVDKALKIADRVLVVKTGTIAFDGFPKDLLQRETIREIIFGKTSES